MKNTLIVITAIVIIASTCYLTYIANQDNLRKKELDKKMSDGLDDQKEINKLIRKKLESNELNIISISEEKTGQYSFSSNGKDKKKRVKLKKEDIKE